MGNLDRRLDTNKKILDLREGWIQIKQEDVEEIINNKDKWNYWRFNEDKTRITTLKSCNITNYEVNGTEILFGEISETPSDLKQNAKSKILMDLFLSPENKVRDTRDAYEKAKYSNKKTPVFWFISKWEDKAVIVLDFSQWKEPKITSYPLDKYMLKMKVVNI